MTPTLKSKIDKLMTLMDATECDYGLIGYKPGYYLAFARNGNQEHHEFPTRQSLHFYLTDKTRLFGRAV